MHLRGLSLTPRFRGVTRRSSDSNRFSDFARPGETAEAVHLLHQPKLIPLKRGVNESATIQRRAPPEPSRLANQDGSQPVCPQTARRLLTLIPVNFREANRLLASLIPLV